MNHRVTQVLSKRKGFQVTIKVKALLCPHPSLKASLLTLNQEMIPRSLCSCSGDPGLGHWSPRAWVQSNGSQVTEVAVLACLHFIF